MPRGKWGEVRQVQLPSSIIQHDAITLSAPAIKSLAVMLNAYSAKQRYQTSHTAEVKVSQKGLMLRTGLGRGTISKATRELREAGYILSHTNRKAKRKNGSGVATYSFLRPPQADRPLQQLQCLGVPQRLLNQTDTSAKGRSLLWRNGVWYFRLPKVVVMQSEMPWSMAKLSSSEFLLYIAILSIGSPEPLNQFQTDHTQLQRVSGLWDTTYEAALETLEDRGLIWVTGVTGSAKITVYLCNPESGDPIPSPEQEEDDPANWYTTNAKGASKRVVTNTGSPEERETLLRSCIPDGELIIVQSSGDLTILCPFHDDGNPSCSVSLVKRCFNCFGCGKKGRFSELIVKLSGSPARAIQRTAAARGQTVEFMAPVTDYYDYKSANGKDVLKQVRRHTNGADGKKRFSQCRPGTRKGEWIKNVEGVGPVLYHNELLKRATVIVLVEGEKDADSVTDNPQMRGRGFVGVTSGGARSWDPLLANLLRDHRVVVLPDDDAAGAAYADDIVRSLTAEGISHSLLSFAGTGAKDATAFLEMHPSGEELERMIEEACRPSGPATHLEGQIIEAQITI